MIELYDVIDSCSFTSCNEIIKRRIMITSSTLLANPLALSHNRTQRESQYHSNFGDIECETYSQELSFKLSVLGSTLFDLLISFQWYYGA